jgi:hypothetical protein
MSGRCKRWRRAHARARASAHASAPAGAPRAQAAAELRPPVVTRDTLRALVSQARALRVNAPELEPLAAALAQLDAFHVRPPRPRAARPACDWQAARCVHSPACGKTLPCWLLHS